MTGVGTHVPCRDDILDAAAASVAEGMEAPTAEAMAEHAGVSPATVYRRFGDRDGLDAEIAATSLMGMVVTHSPLLPALTGVDPGDPGELADRIAELFLRAIAAEPHAQSGRER